MAPRNNKKVASSLVTLSSAAIVAVYAAGFMKTRAAAEKMEDATNERRPSMPAPSTAGETRPPALIEPPAAAPAAEATATVLKSPVMPKPDAPVRVTSPAHDAMSATVLAEKPGPSSTETAAPAAAPEHTAPAPSAFPESASAEPAALTSKADEKPAGGRRYPKEHYNDGTYLGWGTSRHGDIQASVTIKDGRIEATSIAQCLTRYSCSWISHLPGQVVARQSQDCDYVSGATQSANAFYYAVVDALNKAK